MVAESVAPGPPRTEHGLTVQPSRSQRPNAPVWSTVGAPGTVGGSGSQEGVRRPRDVLLSTWLGSGAPFSRQLPPRTACSSLLRGLWNWAEQVPRAPEEPDKNVTGSFPPSCSRGRTEEPGAPGPLLADCHRPRPWQEENTQFCTVWGTHQGAPGFEHRPPQRKAHRRGTVHLSARLAPGQVPGPQRGERGHATDGGQSLMCAGHVPLPFYGKSDIYRKIWKDSHQSGWMVLPGYVR